jgi:undecaprenyl-diphosphatase
VLLGIVQGVTEFLPISSSGHLVVFRRLLGLQEIPILYDVLLHVSTLGVVLVVFRARIGAILASLVRSLGARARPAVEQDLEQEDRENLWLALLVVLATLVTMAVGLAISRLEDRLDGWPRLVSVAFAFTGVLLLLTRFAPGDRSYRQAGARAGLIVGLAQGVGVLAGVSRSGITIAASLFCGLERRRAGEFAFLIAVPAILGATLLKLPEAGRLMERVPPAALAAGMASSFAAGFFSLKLLLRLIRGGKLYFFSLYLIPLAVVTFLLF